MRMPVSTLKALVTQEKRKPKSPEFAVSDLSDVGLRGHEGGRHHWKLQVRGKSGEQSSVSNLQQQLMKKLAIRA